MSDQAFRVLFVCLGNICRSPLAEGVFRQHVQEAGLGEKIEIASAGTAGWHEGKPPDHRMCETASERGVEITHQRARQLSASDLRDFDLVLAMDRENLTNIKALATADTPSDRVELFRRFDPEPGTVEVPDPYYGGQEGFIEVFEIVDRTSRALLAHLSDRLGSGNAG